jgi:hypothetical protein
VPKQSGILIATSIHGVVETPTYKCVHCGRQFTVIRGSGKMRGFCQPCGGVTCGQPRCFDHFPFEKRLDLVEAGKMPLIEL